LPVVEPEEVKAPEEANVPAEVTEAVPTDPPPPPPQVEEETA
jgi:hypothetical protein